jgi:hypothetical protein
MIVKLTSCKETAFCHFESKGFCTKCLKELCINHFKSHEFSCELKDDKSVIELLQDATEFADKVAKENKEDEKKDLN